MFNNSESTELIAREMKLFELYAVTIMPIGFKSQWHISFRAIYSIDTNGTNLGIS